MRKYRKFQLIIALTVFLVSSSAFADDYGRWFNVDVAMDGNSFFFEGGVNDAGFPLNGTPFVIRGYIYAGGTFKKYGLSSGVDADGKAQFPVIGTWICRGWHMQDGDALTGVVVATTQIFDFKLNQPGRRTIVTDGIELADFEVPFQRAIIGGTGKYRKARGHMTQEYVGVNDSFGFNTSFRIRLH